MKVIGHRGAASLAPENTFAGFDIALALGVDAIETDVQMTTDGKLVLFHDYLIDRTSNGKGRLQDMTWDEVKNLDIGSWFHPFYADQRIPLLADFLHHFGKRTDIDLEIKQQGIEEKVIGEVKKADILDRITFTSFDFQIAAIIKHLVPHAKVGFLTSDISESLLKRVVDAHLTQFSPDAAVVSKELVKTWKDIYHLVIRVCRVKDEEVMKKAIDAEVDGMTVDFPHLLLKELGRDEKVSEVLATLPSF